MPDKKKNSFTYPLTKEQATSLLLLFAERGYKRRTGVPYTVASVEGPRCIINVYTSGKCVIQGRGAEDFVLFTLEPEILKHAALGYEDVWDATTGVPHLGSDESGKGDFFGPLVACAAYADKELAGKMRDIGVKDCKQLTDITCLAIASRLETLLGNGCFKRVMVGVRRYNQLYAKMHSVNRILAWIHAQCIAELFITRPDVQLAVADQFGDETLIATALKSALKKRGLENRAYKLDQHHKAESDIAVAAASILARATFLRAIAKMSATSDLEIPKGATNVRDTGVELVKKHGPQALLDCCKCHFRTTDQVLETCGLKRDVLGPDGAAVSQLYADKKTS